MVDKARSRSDASTKAKRGRNKRKAKAPPDPSQEDEEQDDTSENDNNSGQSDDECDESELYASLYFEKNNLGIAVYDALTSKLTINQLVVPHLDLRMVVDQLVTQIEPGTVIVSKLNVAKHNILSALDNVQFDRMTTQVRKVSPSITIQVAVQACTQANNNAVDFAYLKGCKEIEGLRIGTDWSSNVGVFDDSTKREKYKYLSSYFDFDSLEMIRAVGALVAFLSSEKISNQLDSSAAVFVAAVEQASFDGIMLVDSNTLKALQIFNQVNQHWNIIHPKSRYGSRISTDGTWLINAMYSKSFERSKEGFSIYALLDNTITKSGKLLLRQWLLKPLTDVAKIESRHTTVAYFVESRQSDLVKDLTTSLRGFRDAFRILRRVKTMRAKGRDWCALQQCISCFLAIRKELVQCSMPANLNLVEQISSISSIQDLNNLLCNVVDFDATKKEASCIIREGVSAELDAARDKLAQVDQILVDLARILQDEWPQLKSISLQFLPRVGYVIQCPSAAPIPPILQFQFEDSSFSFYKCPKCRKLDEDFGDIHGYISDIQHRALIFSFCAA
ncbi:hypothetical protein AaE_014995 [Aphanomyces astaci]|uniref:DNA mismatch repair protein MutS core domain-containing protein n=1 Tax=Aphanomyces astaci TaxID=112090 RepID=A0A6A4YZ84_APHAT|nr:hypothetical protein AaE_014995 [Aphanomyces astaci]